MGHSVGRCVVRFFSQSCRRSVVQALAIWLVGWRVGGQVGGWSVGCLLGWLVGWFVVGLVSWWVVL